MRVTGSMTKAQYERDAICNMQHTIPMQVPAKGGRGRKTEATVEAEMVNT